MMRPLVSIVIPVYNSEKTVGKCLDSLINQTYDNIEIICVNDCSKDNSLEELEAYARKDSRIRIINHEENKNAGGARNSGIKAATGDYICFVDNDDWLELDAIAKLTAEVEDDTDMVASDWIDYSSDNKKIIRKNLISKESFDENLFYVCHNGFRMLGCLFKRTLFFENDLFFPERIFYEDNAILMSLFYVCRHFKYIEVPLYYYASVPTSVTRSSTVRKLSDRTTTIEMHIQNMDRLCKDDNQKELLRLVALRLCYRSLYLCSKFSVQEIKEVLDRTIGIINNCLPNLYFKQMSYWKWMEINNPYATFYMFKMGSHLLPLYRKLRK